MWDHVSFMSYVPNRKDPMPSNDSGTVSIPAIGLTFTPVAQPEPTMPKFRPITSFPLGSQVVEHNHPGIYTVVEDRTDGKDTICVMKDNKVYRVFHSCWLLESETKLTCNGYQREPKPIPAAPAPLVSYDELQCGEVAVISRGSFSHDTYIYKGHFNGECMWWYGTVDMAVRVLDRRGDNDGGFGFSGGAKVLRVVGILRNNLRR